MTNRLSLALIVRNEKNNLPHVLRNAKVYADEIIVVDTGSQDNSKKVAEQLGAKVFNFTWVDDFTKARNYALSKCRGNYVMWLDADDVVSDENAVKIKRLVSDKGNWDVCYLPYNLDGSMNCKVVLDLA